METPGAIAGYEIWLVGRDGGDERRLARGFAAAWSPDGREVAVTRRVGEDSFDITVIDIEESVERVLVRDGSTAVWSPGGERVLFEKDDGLYVLARDDLEVERVTSGAGDSCGTWSPNGDRVAFASGRNGDVYLVNDDGSDVRRLSRSGNRANGAVWQSCPVWSPDGELIAFSALAADGDNELVYVVDPDERVQRALSPNAEFVSDADPVWSPDGKALVFTNDVEFGELWIVHADGSGRRRFVRGPYSEADQGLDWARD